MQTIPWHRELKDVARGVTRNHSHHYSGFAETQWDLFAKENPPRVKPLLYVYRVLLSGVHMMRTGTLEANLVKLNQEYRLPYISELVQRKVGGKEKSTLQFPEVDFHKSEYERLVALLETASAESALPDTPTCREALNDLLVRVRLQE